jgi:hypothetical protein
MCFLRPARGFGWLDPILNRLCQRPVPSPSPARVIKTYTQQSFSDENERK